MSIKIIKDTSAWKAIRKNLQDVSKKVAQVGFFDTYYGPENDNLPVAQVAQWNEEGEGIPMRSFIRAGFIETLKKDSKFNEQVFYKMGLVAEGKMNMEQLLSSLGPELALMMKKEIIEFKTPRNAPLTISLKGKDDPLRDSDTMLNAVDWRIGSKGTIK